MPKFLIRSKPYKEEALQQYLLRVAKVNGYSIKALNYFIFQRTGFSYRNNSVESRELISQLLFTMTGHKEVLDLFDQRLWSKGFKSLFDNTRLKICPQCLSEYGHCFSEWYYLHNLVCMQHKVYLVEQCDKCHRVFTDASFVSGECLGCGYALHAMDNHECLLPYFYGNDSLIASTELSQKKLAKILEFTKNLAPYYRLYSLDGARSWMKKGVGNIHKHAKILAQVISFQSSPKQITNAFVGIIYASQELYSISKSLGSMYLLIIQPRYLDFRHAFRQAFFHICKEFPNMYISMKFLAEVFGFNVLNINENQRKKLVVVLHQRSVLYLKNVEPFLNKVLFLTASN